jgi:predicted membrane channel-forming protein YqfA (hemolysin III family)
MNEDSFTAISVIFEYGIPALLIIFGYIAYVLSFNYNNLEIHDFGVALMIIGIIFYFIELVARGLSETEDQLAPLRAISTVFAYGIPALLIILGFMAYFRAIPYGESDLLNVGLALLIVGIIFYFIEMVARLVQRFSEPK